MEYEKILSVFIFFSIIFCNQMQFDIYILLKVNKLINKY